MVWGAIGYNYKLTLVFIDSVLNAEEYRKLLEDNGVFDSCREVYGNSFLFQQDGAPSHTAKSIMDEQRYKIAFGMVPKFTRSLAN